MRWLNRALVSTVLLSLLALASRLVLVHRHHFSIHGHVAPLGLHADAIVSNASIGIPGRLPRCMKRSSRTMASCRLRSRGASFSTTRSRAAQWLHTARNAGIGHQANGSREQPRFLQTVS